MSKSVRHISRPFRQAIWAWLGAPRSGMGADLKLVNDRVLLLRTAWWEAIKKLQKGQTLVQGTWECFCNLSLCISIQKPCICIAKEAIFFQMKSSVWWWELFEGDWFHADFYVPSPNQQIHSSRKIKATRLKKGGWMNMPYRCGVPGRLTGLWELSEYPKQVREPERRRKKRTENAKGKE